MDSFLYDLFGQLKISLGALGFYIVMKNGFTMTGRFRQTNIAGNQGPEHVFGETTLRLTLDLASQFISCVKHSKNHAQEFQFRI